MVWIHGGGFTAGGASEPRHDGQYLAHHDVIVVTLNYRLGIFGFFAHPGLTAESPHHASGNYGLLDQAAAIAWVKRNIAEFGGDPKNITLFGESAGSFSVAAQMASPLSKGLLAKAIGESGAPFAATLPYLPLPQAEAVGSAFGANTLHAASLADLRSLSADDLVRAASAKGAPRFSPDIDGYFLPAPVPEIYAAGQQAHIPLLAGWNADEGRATALNAQPPITSASFTAEANTLYGDQAPKFLAAYPASTDAEALASAGDLAGDRFIAFSTWRWMEAHVKTGAAPTYRYFFTLAAPLDRFHGTIPLAFHSDDIEYVFGTLESRLGAHWRAEDRALSDQIQQYWTNFARTGDPNAPGLPVWPTYGPTQWNVMSLAAESKAAPDAHRDRDLFLDANPPKPQP
jgi:para-nitrobenzyl esterase